MKRTNKAIAIVLTFALVLSLASFGGINAVACDECGDDSHVPNPGTPPENQPPDSNQDPTPNPTPSPTPRPSPNPTPSPTPETQPGQDPAPDPTPEAQPDQAPTLDNFNRTRTYAAGTFTDVAAGRWYADWVARAYEYGIISGVSAYRFDPAGNLTGAQALTIAARIHSIYKYGAEAAESKIDAFEAEGGYWYDKFVLYAKAEKLVGNEFDGKLHTPITRAEMLFAWSKVLQATDMQRTNTVNNLPDVDESTLYHDTIIMFYEAGIVSGADASGTFHPGNNISRAEAAAIFLRLVENNARASDQTFGTP